jgi:hypothetical protein
MAYIYSLSRSIIDHDLPFSFAEYDGINATNKILNPAFCLPISKNTARAYCMMGLIIQIK